MDALSHRVDLLAKALRWIAVAIAVALTSIAWQSYEGRAGLVKATRRGCERSKVRDAVNGLGWRTAQHRALSQGQPGFAAIYDGIASTLEALSHIDCAAAFPAASPWPWSQP